MNKPSDYFNKLDLAHLDANTAQFIREKVLTLPNIDILEGTKEFETIKAIVEENFPRAIGIEPVVIEPIIEVVHEPIIEEVVEEIVEPIIEPIIDTKQEEIKTISGQVSEMTDLIDLLSELVAENPSDLDSLDVLELYKENLVELADKLKSLTEVITEAVIEVKDNIEEVKEVIKTDVVDTKGILTAPKQYKTEDGQNVLGYESDWNFGLNNNLGETVVYYVSNEDDKNKYSVLSGILHKGEIVYSEDKTSNKEFENYSENVEEALKLAYELANDKEAVDKYSLGGVLLGAALGVVGTLGYQKVVAKNSIPVKKEKAKTEKWNDVINAHADKEGLDNAMSDSYSDWKDVKAPAKFYELRTSYLKGKKTLENHIDKKLSGKNKESVLDAIDKEGFDSAFEYYSDFKEVKDTAFHKLIKSYLKSKKELSDYIGLDKYEKGGILENEKYSTLAYKTKKSAEKSESQIKDYFGDRFLKSEVLQGEDERGNYGYQVHYELSKDEFEKGGSLVKYVAVHESKDGYWTIASKPSSKEDAEAMLGGTPKNEVGKVVTLEEARAHKKTVGEEYLYEEGGSIGFIPMGLENDLAIISRRGGLKSVKDVIGILNAMIDSGLNDEDLKTPPTKTGFQYQKALDKKTREILDKIEGNIGESYKDGLKGNMPYSAIRLMVENKSNGKNLLKEFKPWRENQKFENGGKISNEIVLNEGNGIIINKLYNKWQKIKTEKEHDAWSDLVKKTKFGTYGTIGIFEVLEKFEPKFPNEIIKRDFTNELKKALGVSKDTYVKFENGGEVVDNKHTYMMLGRLQMDNDYFLGNGNRGERNLWAGNVDGQIEEMKKLWNSLPENGKPEWLSMEDILDYERKMKGIPSDSDKDENIAKIRFNDHWKTVQLYIDGSLYGEFDDYQDAINEAKNNNSKIVLEDDVTMLNISSENPLSRQLSKITGDGWNDIDYENLDGSKNVSTIKPFKHLKSGKIFEVVNK